MSEEPRFLPIEERLRAEARHILRTERQPSAARLWNEYQRRRAAPVRFAAATTVVVAVALGALFGWRPLSRAPRPERQGRPAVARLKHENPTVHEPPVAEPLPGNSQLPSGDPADETLFAIPFVIDDPASGEEIMSGFYVPERAEPLDLRQLPPAERDAVRAVLGIEDDTMDGEVI